jgi:Flp pilus assembly protein TadD
MLTLIMETCDPSADAFFYRRKKTLPDDGVELALDLALSLALSCDYPNAIAVLQPLAMAPTSSPRQRQTLALIYGLQGNVTEAARLGRIDLDDVAVEHNLAYYQSLRELSPEARSRAILSKGT